MCQRRGTAGRRATWACVALICAGCSGSGQRLFDRAESSLAPASEPQTAGQPAALPVAPTQPPPPALDPDVTFEWDETLPGKGTCKAGTYSGKFTCEVQDPGPLELLTSPRGNFSFTLGDSGEQQQLPIVTGSMEGGVFRGSLQGGLDCASNALRATSSDGRALFGMLTDPNPVFEIFSSFRAQFDGVLQRETLVIEGVFSMTSESGRTCAGQFTANAMP